MWYGACQRTVAPNTQFSENPFCARSWLSHLRWGNFRALRWGEKRTKSSVWRRRTWGWRGVVEKLCRFFSVSNDRFSPLMDLKVLPLAGPPPASNELLNLQKPSQSALGFVILRSRQNWNSKNCQCLSRTKASIMRPKLSGLLHC